MKEKTKLCCCTTFFILTLLLAIAFVASYVAFPYAVEYVVAKQDTIVPGSELTKDWITPPVPLYATFTFFNVTNPGEVSKGAKANLTQVGPFYYKYYRNKFNVTWDDDESRVSYHLDTYYVFDKELSLGDPKNITIITLNVPLLGLLLKLETYSETIKKRFGEIIKDAFLDAIEEFLRADKDNQIFYEINAYDLLWGYHDPVLQILKDFRLTDDATFYLEQNHSTNDTQGWSTVKTGKCDPKTVGEFTQWNNLREIALWNSSAARKMSGTEGYLFHSNIKHDDVLKAYITELFRSGDFVHSFDTDVYGIQLYHFVVAPYEFENDSTYPPNYGYSAFGKPGVLNLTAVFPENMPVFVSKPHFLDADESYLHGVNGLHPNRSINDSFLEVEPLTGAVLHAAKRLQFNVLLEQNNNIEQLKHVRESTMFPWFVATEESIITESKADEFKANLLTPIEDTKIGLIVGIGVFGALSLVMLAGVVYASIRYYRYRRQRRAEAEGTINSRTPLLSATLLNQSDN